MITPLTPRNLTRLRCEKSVIEHFVGLVSLFLANKTSRRHTITDELSLLIELCNHHRNLLWQIYRNGDYSGPEPLKDWLHEIATPPSGDWAELRLALTPFIRTFGRLPRPKGTQLFSGMGQPARDGVDLVESGPRLHLVSFKSKEAFPGTLQDDDDSFDPSPGIDSLTTNDLPPIPFQASVAAPA